MRQNRLKGIDLPPKELTARKEKEDPLEPRRVDQAERIHHPRKT
jgi:hypothetical protein